MLIFHINKPTHLTGMLAVIGFEGAASRTGFFTEVTASLGVLAI